MSNLTAADPNRPRPIVGQEDAEAAAPLIGKGADAAIERKTIPFEFKAISDEGFGSFEGIGAAFNNIDGVGDIIAKGAFEEGLKDFLDNGFIGGVDHDWKSVIGHPASARETPDGLFVRGVFDNTPEAQATRAKMTPHPETGRATIRKLSIGYKALPGGFKFLEGPDECKAYWSGTGYEPSAKDLGRAAGQVRLLTKLKLFEVSPVLVPANDLAQTTGVKSAVPAGFAEHSHRVASAAGDFLSECKRFVERFEARAEARLKDGRGLSAANREAFREAFGHAKAAGDGLADLCAKMAAILDASEPGARAEGEWTAPNEAELLARFAQVMYATNPCLA